MLYLTTDKQQLARWVENFSELYAQPRPIISEAITGILCLPLLQDLDNFSTMGWNFILLSKLLHQANHQA